MVANQFNWIGGTNSISTGTKIVPVGPWGPRTISLSSEMMNSQPQHIQKRRTVDLQIIQYKYKSKKKSEPFNLIEKCPSTKVFVLVDQSWSPITTNRPMESWFTWRGIQISVFFLSWSFSCHPLPLTALFLIATCPRAPLLVLGLVFSEKSARQSKLQHYKRWYGTGCVIPWLKRNIV